MPVLDGVVRRPVPVAIPETKPRAVSVAPAPAPESVPALSSKKTKKPRKRLLVSLRGLLLYALVGVYGFFIFAPFLPKLVTYAQEISFESAGLLRSGGALKSPIASSSPTPDTVPVLATVLAAVPAAPT